MVTFEFIQKVLLLILVALQIIVMIYLLYINRQRYKHDQEFWKEMNDAMNESIEKYNKLYPEEPFPTIKEENKKS